jgi:hypothetical protein
VTVTFSIPADLSPVARSSRLLSPPLARPR